MLLENGVAIVSGVGPGLGRDVSLALAQEGADLAIGARTPSRLEEVAHEIESLGRRVLALRTDIGSASDCANLAERTRKEFGRIDALVNNAFHDGDYTRFEDNDVENFRAPFEVNTLGSLRLTKAVLPTMKAQRRGSIIMINSMIVRDVLPGFSAYAASKGALLAATRGLARELGEHGIRVNSVVPGYIWGPALEGYFETQAAQRGVDARTIYAEVAAGIALGRIPTSKEIAGAVVFFASDLSQVVTGQTLDVNGGHVMV